MSPSDSDAKAGQPDDRPFIHPLFCDHMVLQRDVPAPIWGWTTPGAEVTVTFCGKMFTCVADAQGRWQVAMGPFLAGGPFILAVKGPVSLTIRDVFVGDVWLCSGQSNMEWQVNIANNPDEEKASANHPQMRLLTVPQRTAYEAQELLNAAWKVCAPETVGDFSAVGYFFGRHIHQELNMPVGLINASWGGTIAEAWVSAGSLRTLGDFDERLDMVDRTATIVAQGKAREVVQQWYKSVDPGTAKQWHKPAINASSWKEVVMPMAWEQCGLPDYDGIVWFQRSFDIPKDWAGKDLMLNLGPVDDNDTTWINGVEVGATEGWYIPRVYRVPAAAVKTGRNVVTVRVLDTGGAGGLTGTPEQYSVHPADDHAASVPLAGTWRMQETVELKHIVPVPAALNDPNICTVLYNGMIAPLVPFAIKGAIWYQGESNASRAYQYRSLLPTLIKDWRTKFGVGDFGFHIVSLANYLQTSPTPVDNDWAELREAQAMTARSTSNCGIAMAIDIGEANDIHPRNKQEVGRRLALAALAISYGKKNTLWSGPWYRSMEIAGKKIRLSFDHTGEGLVAHGGKLSGFAIAGEDRKFVWATASVDGDTVLVSSPEVPKPVAVRYAWDINPVCNLCNKAGLPAVPFRTDDWPTVTLNNK